MFMLTALTIVLLNGMASAPEPADHAKDGVQVVCHGRLLQGVVAIGGETTGTTISFDGMTWELKLSEKQRDQLAQDEYRQVTVTGRLHPVQGVERGTRWVVDVEKLTKRDARTPKPKAEFTMTGKLMAKAVEIDGEPWPIVWDDAPDLQTQAAALSGKTVIAQGTAAANTEGGPKKYPIFHVTKLQAK